MDLKSILLDGILLPFSFGAAGGFRIAGVSVADVCFAAKMAAVLGA